MKSTFALATVFLAGSVLLAACNAGGIHAPANARQDLAIDHILIMTNDFDRLTQWHIDVLGFEFEDRWTAPDVVSGLELS